jgi:hypothetical protein
MKPVSWASFTGLRGWETIVAFRFRRPFLFVTFLLGEQKKSDKLITDPNRSHPMPKLSVIALFLIIIITTTPILTQDPNTTPGHWRDWVNEINISRDRTGPALSTNETDAVLDRLTAIGEIIRSTPVLSKPIGFEVKPVRRINVVLSELVEQIRQNNRPIPAELHIYLYPYFLRDGRIFEGEELWAHRGVLSIFVNNPAPGWATGYRTVNGEQWYTEPKMVDRSGDVTRYEAHVLARREAQQLLLVAPWDLPPLWTPVTREMFIRDEISVQEKQLEEGREKLAQLPSADARNKQVIEGMQRAYEQMKTINPEAAEQMRAQMDEAINQMTAGQDGASEQERAMREGAQRQLDELEQRIGAMRAELNSMSPANRRSQASIILDPQQTDITGLAKPGTTGASPLVRINPDLFGAGTSPTAFRFLIITLNPERGRGDDWAKEKLDEIIRDIDWEKLTGVLN